ncbi:ras-related protein Rab-37 isoform X2 [Ambystoma mexicanum]|uniref:ras-related protein Rab-37 isoform X2 n=1 Tax=Ambystoma mexicanum TaxID=8296 RepID=UPI0037E957BE
MPGPRGSVRSPTEVCPGGAANGTPRMRLASSSRGGSEDQDLTCKVMLLGDTSVGKTCFVIQYKDGAFLSGTFLPTVGIDFRNKVVTVDDVKVKLQIWDTAGQERFRSVTHAYYRDAEALLLLYDITNRTSFDNIRAWLTEISEYAQKDVVIMLLGNKCDMNHERIIRPEDGENLAKEYGVPFMETSAKTGVNVDLAFLAVAKLIFQQRGPLPFPRFIASAPAGTRCHRFRNAVGAPPGGERRHCLAMTLPMVPPPQGFKGMGLWGS